MNTLEVIADPAAAAVALHPVRSQLLAAMGAPASAATLGPRVGLSRQKVNYHLGILESHGLVREAETRQWGGLTERLLVASAASYVMSPAALGPLAPDPQRESNRLSANYLLALAARAVREVSDLVQRAAAAKKPLATLSLDATIRFRSAAERAAFTQELTKSITSLAAKYHDEQAPGGRSHRLVVLAHPVPLKSS